MVEGSCKPETATKLRVVLYDPALQEHRDHMTTYVIICYGLMAHKEESVYLDQKQLETKGGYKSSSRVQGLFHTA